MHLDDFVAIAERMAVPLAADAEISTIVDRLRIAHCALRIAHCALRIAQEMAGKLAADPMDQDQAAAASETIHADVQLAQHFAQGLGANGAGAAQAMADFIRHIISVDLGHSMVGPWPMKNNGKP